MRSVIVQLLAWVFAAPVLAEGGDWPGFLGPGRDGVYSGPAIASTFSDSGPKTVWSRKVGEGFAGPVVALGKLILFHRADNKEIVECLDALTGKQLWSADYPAAYRDDFGFDEGPRATPSIDSGRVYTLGADGVLSAWDLESGARRFQIDLRAQFKSDKGYFGFAGSPLVEGDALILNIGGKNGAGIIALNKADGKLLWKATNDEASYASPVAANIDGQRRVLVLTRSRLVGLAPADGKVVFEYPFSARIRASVNAASPLVIDNSIFLSASYNVGAALIEIGKGAPRVLWASDEALSAHYATPVQHGGFLYGFDGRQEQKCSLRCVELLSGKARWNENGFGAGTLILAGKHLVIMNETGELILAAASPDGFKATSRTRILESEVRAHPALAEGRFYARDKTALICVDLRH